MPSQGAYALAIVCEAPALAQYHDASVMIPRRRLPIFLLLVTVALPCAAGAQVRTVAEDREEYLWWFVLLVMLVLAAVVTWVVRSRVRQLLAVERLRAALAADLHDHIGAGLTEIAILSEIVAQRSGQSEAAEMARIAETARRLVDQMDDIVWLVNPRRDSLHELFLRLKDSYAELFSHAGILFRTTNLLLFEHVHLPMEYRQNLYLIFKEALHNSLRHSGCSEIELSVALRGRRLEVVLKDDGRGFDPDGTGGRGDGLDNMRRRAALIGGRLAIDSAPARGTAVAFIGPLAGGAA